MVAAVTVRVSQPGAPAVATPTQMFFQPWQSAPCLAAQTPSFLLRRLVLHRPHGCARSPAASQLRALGPLVRLVLRRCRRRVRTPVARLHGLHEVAAELLDDAVVSGLIAVILLALLLLVWVVVDLDCRRELAARPSIVLGDVVASNK